MFKNRAFQVKLVKERPSNTTETVFNIEPEKINQIVKESVKNIGIGVVAVVGSLIVLTTAKECAIKATPQH